MAQDSTGEAEGVQKCRHIQSGIKALSYGICLSPSDTRALSLYSLTGMITFLSRFLTFFSLATLAFATAGNDYRSACQAVKAAISNASEVYYPGE